MHALLLLRCQLRLRCSQTFSLPLHLLPLHFLQQWQEPQWEVARIAAHIAAPLAGTQCCLDLHHLTRLPYREGCQQCCSCGRRCAGLAHGRCWALASPRGCVCFACANPSDQAGTGVPTCCAVPHAVLHGPAGLGAPAWALAAGLPRAAREPLS